MKNILQKFFSGFTVFMMIMSFAGPVNVRAQDADATLGLPPVEAPIVDITEDVDDAVEVPTTPEEGEKKEEASLLRVPLTILVDEPQTATISATKVLCSSETMLPNWGDDSEGDPNTITDSTAINFVESTEGDCEIVPWTFEWIVDGAGDENSNDGQPQDNENSLADWDSFTTTDTVPANSTVWVREQVKSGYTPFSGDVTSPYDDVSAEIYCGSDVLNYDNYDYIDTDPDTTYHCVAFNAHPDVCSNLKGIQVEVPDGYTTNEGGCFVPTPVDEEMCQEGDQTGWNVKYYNYTASDTGMDLPQGPAWTASYGDPLGAWTGWSYGLDKYTHSTVEADLMFTPEYPTRFEPFDVAPGVTYKNESMSGTGGKDFHFGLHAKAYVNAPVAGSYAYELISDDDVWVYVDRVLVADNSGVHGATTANGSMTLQAGINEVDLFYAERHVYQAQLDFKFVDDSLVITPGEPCPPEELVCKANVNLVQNGSFENPPVTNSALWDVFPTGTPTLEWLVAWLTPTATPANIELQKNTLLGVTASNGTQWTELDADQDGPSGSLSGEPGSVSITQTIATIPGKTYKVSFDFMPRPDVAGAESKIEALHDATIGSTVDDTAGAAWSNHTYSFVANDASADITFRDAGATSNSVGTFLDNVVVSCVPEVVVDVCPWNENIPADSEYCEEPIEVIDLCLNLPGFQSEAPLGFTYVGEGMCYSQYECSDNIDNSDSEDELADANDPACHTDGDVENSESYDPYDMSEENTTDGGDEPTSQRSSSSGNRPNGGQGGEGEVLGATSDVCEFSIDTYMRKGYKNNTAQVKVMQMLMNKYAGATLSTDGLFGAMTEKAVKDFQVKYADEILKGAWGITSPTGIFFRSTLAKAKNLECPEVVTPIPTGLTDQYNWSKTPVKMVPAN